MLNPVKQYTLSFISDGIANAFSFDLTAAPFSQVFVGAQPKAVLLPVVSSSQGVVAGVVAVLNGTTVTLTFQNPLSQNDGNGNLLIYTFSFYLQF